MTAEILNHPGARTTVVPAVQVSRRLLAGILFRLAVHDTPAAKAYLSQLYAEGCITEAEHDESWAVFEELATDRARGRYERN